MSTRVSAESNLLLTASAPKRLYALLGAIIVATALPGCAIFPKSSNPTADKMITSDVESRFAQDAELEAPNSLNVQTVNGVVYLNGMVRTGLQREDAETVALEAHNVAEVVNSISVIR
jgi:hypothetical protein